MTTWMIQYSYTDDAAGRDAVRPAHRDYLAQQAQAGRMVAFGRFEDDGPPGALLIALGDDQASVQAIVDGDPFFTHGLIATVIIRQWPATWASPGVLSTPTN